jgi:hypothetical protein
LIGDLEHIDQAVGAQGDQSIVDIALQEDVARKKRHNRSDLSSLGCTTFVQHLRKIIDESAVA